MQGDNMKTIDKLEQEVLDELENPYQPYSVAFPYEVRIILSEDGYNTEIIIRTSSEEVRFGRDEKDILLQKAMDNRYGRDTYSKHILDWVSKRLPYIDPKDCDLEYVGTPKVSLIDHRQVKDFIEGFLNNE
jgi:hypothetical protein